LIEFVFIGKSINNGKDTVKEKVREETQSSKLKAQRRGKKAFGV
jgi:hypothetical protein